MTYPIHIAGTPIENQFLAALPHDDLERIFPKLEKVELTYGTTIYDRGEPIQYVYFPTGCIFSMVAVGTDGLALEMGIVGREGMVGLPVFLGDDLADCRVIVQEDGSAMRMTAADFEFECRNNKTLRQRLVLFARLRLVQATLASACHRAHDVEKQLVRWLLMTSDRMQNSEIPVTSEFLSLILGLTREKAAKAIQTLMQRDLIGYNNDRFTILDRPKLLASACKCYTIIRNEELSIAVPA